MSLDNLRHAQYGNDGVQIDDPADVGSAVTVPVTTDWPQAQLFP